MRQFGRGRYRWRIQRAVDAICHKVALQARSALPLGPHTFSFQLDLLNDTLCLSPLFILRLLLPHSSRLLLARSLLLFIPLSLTFLQPLSPLSLLQLLSLSSPSFLHINSDRLLPININNQPSRWHEIGIKVFVPHSINHGIIITRDIDSLQLQQDYLCQPNVIQRVSDMKLVFN
jgi:hypothetical protein